MTVDRHRTDRQDVRSRYRVRPVVYVPLTMLLMLGFGFVFAWSFGSNILGVLASVIVAPVVMVVVILVARTIEWLFS